MSGSRGYCSVFSRLCERLEASRRLYASIVEPIMGFPHYREFFAAESVSRECGFECFLFSRLWEEIEGSEVCIVGPAARGAPPRECRDSDRVIVLDSALDRALESGLDFSIIVGDEDYGSVGVDPKFLSNSERIYLLHVHGDNYLFSWGPRRFCGAGLLFSSQVVCRYPVLGVGGFTDGDRALLLVMGLGASAIIAWGFDFGSVSCKPGRYCFREYKRLKLDLALRLVAEAARVYGYSWRISGGFFVLDQR